MKKTLLFLLVLITSSMICNKSFGNDYNTGLMNSQYMKEFNIFERGTKIPQILTEQPKAKSYFINTVCFEQNKEIPSEKLKEIISDKLNTKLTSDDLSNMTKSITKFYNDNGYDSTTVNVSDEKATQGTLLFTIYEGPQKQIENVYKSKP